MKSQLLKEFREFFSGDDWSDAMSCFFAVADEMYVRDLDIPSQWGYGPGMSSDPRDKSAFQWEVALTAKDDDLLKAGRVLSRYCDLLKRYEKDY